MTAISENVRRHSTGAEHETPSPETIVQAAEADDEAVNATAFSAPNLIRSVPENICPQMSGFSLRSRL